MANFLHATTARLVLVFFQKYYFGLSAPHFLHFANFCELNPLQAGHSQTSLLASGGTKPPLALLSPMKIHSFV